MQRRGFASGAILAGAIFMAKLRSAESAGKVILSRSSGQSWSAQFDAYFVPVHDRAWRDISISKNLVRFSNEISHSTTKYFFQNLVPSRNSRFDGKNSQSRLEALDVEDKKSRSRLEPRD